MLFAEEVRQRGGIFLQKNCSPYYEHLSGRVIDFLSMVLLDAQINKIYRIKRILSGSVKRRLLDMGFTPGSEIFVSAVAPFGGAVLVGVRGFSVALREDAARLIMLNDAEMKDDGE